MTAVAQAVSAVVDQAGLVVSVQTLEQAWRAHAAGPWRWLVVGRRSVGKSRLINRLVPHAEAPVGMGGVTTEPTVHSSPERVLIDTPGLEHELDGADVIEAHLASVDGLLWVIDGLQPLTRVERAAVDRAVPSTVPVVAAVSRLDLIEPSEHASILERVGRLLSSRAGVVVVDAADLEALQPHLGRPDPDRSPRRRRALSDALSDVSTALEHLSRASGPAPADLAQDAARRWQDRVREAESDVASQVRDATLVFRDEALQALHARLLVAAETVRQSLRDGLGEAPTWVPAATDSLDLRGQVQDLMGGSRHVLDGLAAGAAQWSEAGTQAFEGAVELPVSRTLRARDDAIAAAVQATAAAQALLDG